MTPHSKKQDITVSPQSATDSADRATLRDRRNQKLTEVSPAHSKQIKIFCSKKGCPRTVFVDREDTDPINAVSMKMACPWHEGWNGEFDVPIYYDDKGKEITYDSQ